MVIDEKGNSRLEIDPKAALEYVMEHFAPAVPGAWASDCIWTVGTALRNALARAERAEARVAELEAESSVAREALILAGEIRTKIESIERCETWSDGTPEMGTCRIFHRIKQISDTARAALAGKGESR